MTLPTDMDSFYDHLGIPSSCYLGKRLYKKHFYDNGQLDATDKKAFAEDIEQILWIYTIKPTTINIPRFEDDTYEYIEVAFIEVQLRFERRYKRIAEVIQKTIPYPVIIIFKNEDQISLNVARKRINRADSNRIVLDDMHDSGWIKFNSLQETEMGFLRDFQVGNFSFRNLYEFYQTLVSKVVALNCAEHTQKYESETTGSLSDRLVALKELEKLKQEQAEIRNKLKREKNMGTQVQLNIQIKQLRDRMTALTKEI